jgi:putative inorganic carbon (HCO3(-)) transporter
MPLSLVLLSSKVNKSFRILSLVCILLLLPVAVFQGGRTLWSGVVLTVLLIFIGRKYWFFTIVFVSLLAALLMPKPLGDRAKSLIFPFSRQVLSDRIDLARSATNIFKEHPVFGAGLGSFGNLYKPPAAYKNNPTWQHLHAHNIYLEIAAEMGAFGLLAFLAVIIVFLLKFFIYWVKWVKSGGKINVINVAAGAAVIASLISNVSVSSIIVGFQDSLLFWMFLAIALKEVEV